MCTFDIDRIIQIKQIKQIKQTVELSACLPVCLSTLLVGQTDDAMGGRKEVLTMNKNVQDG